MFKINQLGELEGTEPHRYNRSTEFKVAPSYGETFHPTGVLLRPVRESAELSALAQLRILINQDVMLHKMRERNGEPMPQFMLLCHDHEWRDADSFLLPSVVDYVKVRSVNEPLLFAPSYCLYITDPLAAGLPSYIDSTCELDAQVQNAISISYIWRD